MARIEDSGLKAGFVSEDPRAQDAAGRETTEERSTAPDASVTHEGHEAEHLSDQNQPPEDADGPTITMQGVSGKKITGTVKVVKVRKKKADDVEFDKDETADRAEPANDAEPAETAEPAKVEAPVEADEPAKVDEPEKVETPAAAAPVKAEAPAKVEAPVKPAPSEAPAKAEREQPAAKAEEKPARVSSLPEAPRPRKIKAGDGQIPPSAAPVPTPASRRATAQARNSDGLRGNRRRGEPERVKPAKVEAPAPKKAPEAPAAKVDAPQKTAPTVTKAEEPRPRKIGKIGNINDKPAASATDKPAQAATETTQTPKEVRPSGPRKIASGGAPTTSAPAMGRKIASASDDDAKASLAATAELFAQRKAARDAARDRKPTGGPGGSDRRRSDRGPQRSGPGRPSRPPMPGFPGDKDDDDDKPRMTQSPRKPKAAAAPDELTAALTKTTQARRKFQASTDDRSRHREWTENSRANRGPTGREVSRDLKERANRVSRDGLTDEFDAGRRRRRKSRANRNEQPQQKPQIAKLTHVSLPEVLTVKEFAEAIKKTAADVIKVLMKNGVMATANQELDFDTATIIAAEFDITTDRVEEVTAEDILFDDAEDVSENLEQRPPVVVVMGHVDHGKTSLLDYIRKAEVADGEAGGITQHIGAYMVTLNDRKITFLDTPGHEAFTTMRARGAQATDIAILVVAADDGVMPQTIEAINHAKAAETEIIVAINKMDKPTANIDRVKQELSQHGLISEEWGGDTVMVPVSALTGEGIDELLEMVLLTADVMELQADPHRQAKGIIIEAKLDRTRGALATLLVQRGTLRTGDTIVTSSVVGNVRAMSGANAKSLKEAGPSVPVEILGLPEVPEAGELFYVVKDERVARQLADKRRAERREEQIGRAPTTTLESLFSQIAAGEIQDLNIIVKADVVGSVEAVTQSLVKLSNDEINVRVIHGAAGAINESDIRLASVSSAIVIGFNVRPTQQVTDLAREEGVDLRLYSVIYSAIEDVEAAMKGMLAPEFVEEVLGHAEIRDTFKASSIGTIGGAYVTDGKIVRNSKVRLVRDGVVIYDGELASLRRFKDDVREVATNYECGISLERYNDIKVGDVVECYEIKEVAR